MKLKCSIKNVQNLAARQVHIQAAVSSGPNGMITGNLQIATSVDIAHTLVNDDRLASGQTFTIDLEPIIRWNGLLCFMCREPQYNTSSGDVCKNGHGGAPGLEKCTCDKLTMKWPAAEKAALCGHLKECPRFPDNFKEAR